jgi:pimeloyl-ACP methyl ester carboxylesterase
MRGAPPLYDGDGAAERSAWLDVDWPGRQRWVEVDGTPANVIELGAGPPLLFVHGLSGCWQNWLENIPQFARTHRVIAVDLPGFGSSPMPRGEISIPGYARFLEGVCDALAIDAAAVVGNSMGGYVAAELAIASPQRVERLMLVSAAGITAEYLHRDSVMAGARIVALIATGATAHHEWWARRAGLRRVALQLVVRHPGRLSAPLAHELMSGSGKPGFLPAMEAIIAHRISERLPQIACPTFVVWGEDDRVIPVRDARRFGELIPNVRVEILPDTGHVPMLERPATFNALLEAFLAEAPGERVAPAEPASLHADPPDDERAA